MKLSERIQRMIDGMPPEAAVSLPVKTLWEWLDESGPGGFEPDLTVKQVAELYGRATSTVTAWIRAGDLGAYKFNGKEYHITAAALEKFRAKQSQAQ